MEARLHTFVFHITAVLGAEVVEHLPEDIFQADFRLGVNLAGCADRLEDSVVDLELKDISLKDLLVSVYHQYEKYCKTQDIDFKLDVEDDAIINVDEKRIRQVLYNFINKHKLLISY